jgi:hypothetical protein
MLLSLLPPGCSDFLKPLACVTEYMLTVCRIFTSYHLHSRQFSDSISTWPFVIDAPLARQLAVCPPWADESPIMSLAYKVEELLALRDSVSESAVSIDRFADGDVIKGQWPPLTPSPFTSPHRYHTGVTPLRACFPLDSILMCTTRDGLFPPLPTSCLRG